MSDDEQITGFVRQRRNGMLGSLLLMFKVFAGVSIHKLNIFGNEITISNPHIVTLALWVAASYWMWRYYQYYRDLGPKRGIALAVNERLTYRELCAEAQRHLRSSGVIELREPHDIESPVQTCAIETLRILQEGPRYLGLIPAWLQLSVDGQFTWTSGSGNTADTRLFRDVQVRIPFPRLLLPYVRAFLYVSLHTSKATEYLLPYVLFAVPVAYEVARLTAGVIR